METRAELANVASRLGRRPWEIKENFNKMKTVTTIKEMTGRKIRALMRIIHESMDGAHRSIAFANLKKIASKDGSLAILGGKISSEAIAVTEIRKDLVAKLKTWAKLWETRGGVIVVLRLSISVKAAKSIADVMNNTNQEAKKCDEELDCACGEVGHECE